MSAFGIVIGILALAFAPIAFLLWFFYTRDKLNPEPRGLILRAFLLGVVVAIPVLLLQRFLPLPRFWTAVMVVPVVAEMGKYLVVRWGLYPSEEFDEPMDGIIFAVMVGLGYATAENLGYLLLTYLKLTRMTLAGGVPFPLVRAVFNLFAIQGLLNAPAHALWSSLWGYGLGLRKFAVTQDRGRFLSYGILAAIFAHAIFNALGLVPGLLPKLGMVILLGFTWVVVLRCMQQALAMTPPQVPPAQT